jgi:molybdopterin molybdotransferase
MTTVAQAEAMIAAHMPQYPSTRCALPAACGATLREEVHSDRDQPPFDRVTMDGIAIAFTAWAAGRRHFRAHGIQAAGQPALRLSDPSQCIEVMTGSLLPEGADTVVPVERLESDGPIRRIDEAASIAHGQFVHRRGSDRPAGSLLLAPGRVIGPPDIAVLASAGCAEVTIARIPRVAIISTGDELADVGQPVAPHQIRSTNDHAIEASLSRHGLARTQRVRLHDEPDAMLAAIATLHDENDALVLTGGVSMGQFDFVPAVLGKFAVKMIFHKILQRPGRPMWFGVSSARKPVFALPGNPVSTLVCLTRYVCPALRRALGADPSAAQWARLDASVERSNTLTYFVPVRLTSSSDGVLHAEPRLTNTSGDFLALAGTDGFVELPPGNAAFPAGDAARLYLW